MATATDMDFAGPPSHAACPRCGLPLDGSAPDAVPCPTCGEHVHGAYCVHCGTQVETGRQFGVHVESGRASVRAAKVAFGPLAEYAEHARSIIFPKRLVHEIRERHFTGIELLGFWVAAAALTALIAAFLPNPMRRVEIPVLAEVLEALLLITMTVIVYSPLHLLLRRGRREVTFREFMLTTLAVSALLYPWIALSYGVQVLSGVRITVANNINTVVSSMFYVLAYAVLFRRSIKSTLAWFVGYILMAVVAVLVVIVAVALVAKVLGYAPDKPAAASGVAAAKLSAK